MNAPLTHHPAPVREYRDAARLIADARELKRRMWAPTGIVERVEPAPVRKPDPEPLIVVPRRARAVLKGTEEFGPWAPEDPRNVVNVSGPAREIIRQVCVRTGVTWAEMSGRSHQRRIAHARQEAMYAIRMHLGWSTPCIGALFGRDHTTCMHAIRAVEKRLGEARS